MAKTITAVVAALTLWTAGCGSDHGSADPAPSPPGDPASYGCAVSPAIPMTVMPARAVEEPFLSVPTPPGWEFIARDKEMVRGALANAAMRSEDFTPNAVITLAEVSAAYPTAQSAIDAEQAGLAREAHLDSTEDGTLCGYPARRVDYVYEGRDATTLIVAGGDARRRIWVSTIGFQTADPDVAGYARDKAMVLDHFQFLIRHIDIES
jgi:hypothetical protein